MVTPVAGEATPAQADQAVRQVGTSAHETESFGALLRRHRLAASLSQEQLGERAGLSPNAIASLERGRRTAPRPGTVVLLAEALSLTAEQRAAFIDAAPGGRTGQVESEAGSLQGGPSAVLPRLPIPLTRFVGREGEVAQIRRLLATTRLLTLTGTGGIGKTRLALQAATELTGSYPDGVWLVELAPLVDPALIPEAVASSLEIRKQPGSPLERTLADALRPRRLVLVLDNCEHLVTACAELADALLRACPNLRILATSREPLGIGGETVWRVPPLSLPTPLGPSKVVALQQSEAGQLFLERANAALPGFELTEPNAQAIASLCRRLEGIPLALELAAAWVPVLSAEEIAERLDDALRLLVTGSRLAPPRQQTLRATLEWSYRLLSDPERDLFMRLSVFAGGWTLSDAEIVCAGPDLPREAVLDVLVGLVRKSLVLAEPGANGGSRYRLLEPVRQYARERLLETDSADVIHQQHARHFLELAERGETALRGPDQQIWLERLDREHDNLRAALAWAETSGRTQIGDRLAVVLARFWAMTGYLREDRGPLNPLDADAGMALAPRAKLLAGSGWLALLRGDLTRARTDLESSLTLVRQLHDTQEIAETLKNLGRVTLEQGDIALARACFAESLMLSRARGYRWAIAFNLTGLAQVALQRGDTAKAVALFRRALAVYRELDSSRHVAVTLSNLASVLLAQGKVAEARELYAEALEVLPDVHDRFGLAHILAGIAGLAEVCEQPERAQQFLGAAAGLRAHVGYSSSASEHAWPDASLSRVTGRPAAALRSEAWDEGRIWSYDRALSEAALTLG